ncbi:hypothetical protein GCM10022223_46910 [Kineosporia mesophila]|uniref:Uncharacterized protein n=1 Tax=Kineosporia mesophila TaxID=566012 RepID=A0ABP7A3Y7_9ACTN|nr:hypothetical protein [Kineosporia mesophila]MCD5353800.1 hypothetical protein [Kineosporia mesophila]
MDNPDAQAASYAILKSAERSGNLDKILATFSPAELAEVRGNVTEHLKRQGKTWGAKWT